MIMIDLLKVYPRLKQVLEDDMVLETAENGTIKLAPEDSPVMLDFAEGLKIAYAIDEDSYFSLVLNRDMADVDIKDLHEAALENMYNEIREQLSYQGDPAEVIMITNGGNYEATMMLMDGGFWEQIEDIMGGDYYVAVPARDILLIAPKSNPGSIGRLTELINNFFDNPEASGLLVRNIYQRENNSWVFVQAV